MLLRPRLPPVPALLRRTARRRLLASSSAPQHPLAAAAGRGQHPPDARPQWGPYEATRLAAVRRPWSAKAGSRAHVRALRKSGMVPVLVASPSGSRELPLAIAEKSLTDEIERGAFFNRTYQIEIEGDGPDGPLACVPTHVDLHPVQNTPATVIFYEYDENVPRRFDVPLEVVNRVSSSQRQEVARG